MRLSVLCLLTALAAAAGQPAPAGRPLFDHVAHDFGPVPRGGPLVHRFPWSNPSAGPLEILDVRSSCGCATVTARPRLLAPGQSGFLEVQVDTNAFTGPKVIPIHLLLGPGQPQTVVLQVSAQSKPDVVLNPTQVAFGAVPQGTPAGRTVTVEYAGPADLRLTGVAEGGPHLEAAVQETARRPGAVTYRVQVGLKPTAPAGDLCETLYLRTADPSRPAVPVLVTATVQPAVTVAPAVVQFGSARPGQLVVRRVTLRADQPFRVLAVAGTDAQLGAAGSVGTAAAVQTVELTWRPAAAGVWRRTVQVVTDHPRAPVVAVPTEGQGG